MTEVTCEGALSGHMNPENGYVVLEVPKRAIAESAIELLQHYVEHLNASNVARQLADSAKLLRLDELEPDESPSVLLMRGFEHGWESALAAIKERLEK